MRRSEFGEPRIAHRLFDRTLYRLILYMVATHLVAARVG